MEKAEAVNTDSNCRRTAIMEAAAQLFGQVGFEGTSMKTVASAAGEKKTLVQYHFRYKQQLWEETVAYVWQQRNEALPKFVTIAPDDLSAMDAMEKLCRYILGFTFANPTWVKIMFQEASTPGPRLDWMVERFFTRDFADGKGVVELAQARGVLPDVDPMHLLYTLSGALIYLVNVAPIIERVTGQGATDDTFIEHYVATLMHILSGGKRL
jgi:TetR/AcrR family transcriptional regulator|tara:strand:- start:3445 stop:4077 length:633 start_codon:yes stop_codon:yes gene_type:complete